MNHLNISQTLYSQSHILIEIESLVHAVGLPHSVNKAFYFNKDMSLTVKGGTDVKVVHAEILNVEAKCHNKKELCKKLLLWLR